MKRWEPVRTIVIREIWQNKVYSATPFRVVKDTSDWSALHLPPQTPCLWPHTREGETIRIATWDQI